MPSSKNPNLRCSTIRSSPHLLILRDRKILHIDHLPIKTRYPQVNLLRFESSSFRALKEVVVLADGAFPRFTTVVADFDVADGVIRVLDLNGEPLWRSSWCVLNGEWLGEATGYYVPIDVDLIFVGLAGEKGVVASFHYVQKVRGASGTFVHNLVKSQSGEKSTEYFSMPGI